MVYFKRGPDKTSICDVLQKKIIIRETLASVSIKKNIKISISAKTYHPSISES